jgi:hypothetical protein
MHGSQLADGVIVLLAQYSYDKDPASIYITIMSAATESLDNLLKHQAAIKDFQRPRHVTLLWVERRLLLRSSSI